MYLHIDLGTESYFPKHLVFYENVCGCQLAHLPMVSVIVFENKTINVATKLLRIFLKYFVDIFTIIIVFKTFENKILEVIIKQGNSDSEIIICFCTKFKLSVDLIQLLKVITVLGFTSRHFHKLFVE